MTIIIKTIILTVISFVATNIDDLVIDTFFFTEIKNKKAKNSCFGEISWLRISCFSEYNRILWT